MTGTKNLQFKKVLIENLISFISIGWFFYFHSKFKNVQFLENSTKIYKTQNIIHLYIVSSIYNSWKDAKKIPKLSDFWVTFKFLTN